MTFTRTTTRPLLTGVLVVGALTLTACDSDDGMGVRDSATSVAVQPPGDGEADRCRTDELKITASDTTVDGDPEGMVTVRLRNGGGRVCAISGYAGVVLRTSAGTLAARWSGGPIPKGAKGPRGSWGVLEDGEVAEVPVTYALGESGGGSGVRVVRLVVTPPGESESVSLDWPGARRLPAAGGAGGVVKVHPVEKVV
ncbi:DUF4232 domain-containing protein [Streptomyces sp. NPDC005562]|uniref:DUF4232 domain-containing protein n=1 Tax=Streptomyces sp. NPDC005562 TaxID=3154890 RepID=UPI0033BD0920